MCYSGLQTESSPPFLCIIDSSLTHEYSTKVAMADIATSVNAVAPPSPLKASASLSSDVTPAQLAYMKKVISSLMKAKGTEFFGSPMDSVATRIPPYPLIIKKPMDLRTIGEKLRQGMYMSIKYFTDDLELIVENAVTFNGPDHVLAEIAKKMCPLFKGQMSNMPTATVSVDPEKKAQAPSQTGEVSIPTKRKSEKIGNSQSEMGNGTAKKQKANNSTTPPSNDSNSKDVSTATQLEDLGDFTEMLAAG
jgi:hypothetical protein